MSALLASFSIKDAIYGAIIVAILAVLAWVYHKGEVHVEAADTKAVAVIVQHNTKVEANAQVAVTQIAKTFSDVSSAPAAAYAPHLWLRVAPSACPAVADGGTPSKPDGAPNVPAVVPAAGEGSPDAFDFGPPLDKTFETADAQITGLQAYIKECQRIGVCLK